MKDTENEIPLLVGFFFFLSKIRYYKVCYFFLIQFKLKERNELLKNKVYHIKVKSSFKEMNKS